MHYVFLPTKKIVRILQFFLKLTCKTTYVDQRLYFCFRTTTHVHYAPLGQIPIAAMGPQHTNGGSSFDPFLPCHSHHINGDRSRGQRPGTRFSNQPRSSSVPPPSADLNGNGAPRREAPSATSASARTTPLQSPARRLTATIDVNVIPMFPRRQPQQPPQQLLEPGLMNLLGQLSGGANRDPGMMNAFQHVLGQVYSVLSGELTG
jgi:hypothetical protein